MIRFIFLERTDAAENIRRKYWYIDRLSTITKYGAGDLLKRPINRRGQLFSGFTFVVLMLGFFFILFTRYIDLKVSLSAFLVFLLLTRIIANLKTYKKPGKKSVWQQFLWETQNTRRKKPKS